MGNESKMEVDSPATPKKLKRRGSALTESTRKKRKEECVEKSNLNRIATGKEFDRCEKVKEEYGIKPHSDVSKNLLDNFVFKHQQAAPEPSTSKMTSTPFKFPFKQKEADSPMVSELPVAETTDKYQNNLHKKKKKMENAEEAHNIYNRSAIHIAAAENDVERLEKLLSCENVNVNAIDSLGRTALHCLLLENSFHDIVSLKKAAMILKEAGAEINVHDRNMDTPVHLLIKTYLNDFPYVVKTMLEIFPWYDSALQNTDGFYLIHMLMYGLNNIDKERDDLIEFIETTEKIIKYILTNISKKQLKSMLNKKTRCGQSAFQMYIHGDYYDIETIHMMIQKGAEINNANNLGQTALIEAVIGNCTDIIEMLLKAGADPNAKDIFEQTAIFKANSWEALNLLIAYGADDKIKDRFGRSPAIYIQNASQSDMIHMERLSHFIKWWSMEDNFYFLPERKVNIRRMQPYEAKINMVKKYGRIIISEEAINDIDGVLRRLDINDDPQKLIEVMESPVFGMANEKLEFKDIKKAMNDLMQKVATVVSERHELFQVTVKPTGSSSEGTMVGDPCEFDFIFCLDRFADECTVYEPDDLYETGFVFLKLKKENRQFHSFLSKNGYICARRVRKTFQNAVVEALKNKEVWIDKKLYFEGQIDQPDDKPILTVRVYWYGTVYKNITISIDIVTGMFKQNWFPREIDQNKLTLLDDEVKKSGFFLLFHGPMESSDMTDDLMRISCAPMEIAFFRSAPKMCREIYGLSKFMKSQEFCPKIQFDCKSSDKDDSKNSRLSSEMMNEKDMFMFIKLVVQGNLPGIIHFKDIDCVFSIAMWFVAMDKLKLNGARIIKLQHDTAIRVAATEETEFESDTSRQSNSCSDNIPSKMKNQKSIAECKNKGAEKDSIRNECREAEGIGEGYKPEPIQIQNINVGREKITMTFEESVSGESEGDNDESEWEDIEDFEEEMCEEKFEGKEIVEASKLITSYMLKNCMLYVLSDKSLSEDLDHLSVVKEVFEYLKRAAEQRTLKAYYMPFVNIFSYVKDYIEGLSREDIEKEVEESCHKIEHFCQLILGILTQTGKRKKRKKNRISRIDTQKGPLFFYSAIQMFHLDLHLTNLLKKDPEAFVKNIADLELCYP